MTVMAALDSAGRRRSPATMPGYHAGRPPQNKGAGAPWMALPHRPTEASVRKASGRPPMLVPSESGRALAVTLLAP